MFQIEVRNTGKVIFQNTWPKISFLINIKNRFRIYDTKSLFFNFIFINTDTSLYTRKDTKPLTKLLFQQSQKLKEQLLLILENLIQHFSMESEFTIPKIMSSSRWVLHLINYFIKQTLPRYDHIVMVIKYSFF